MLVSRTLNFITLAALWLSISVGCQKEPDGLSCEKEECCIKGVANKYVKRVEGTPANFDGSSFSFKEAITEFNGDKLNGALVCMSQETKLQALNLKSNVVIDPVTNKVRLVDSTRQYPYRVWGTIYFIDISTIGGYPLHGVRIDKVEQAK